MSHCCKSKSNCVCCNKTRIKAPWDNCLDACGKGISCPALTPDNTMISGSDPSLLFIGFNNSPIAAPIIPGQSLNPTNMPSPAVGDITTLYYNSDGSRFELRIEYPTAQTGTTATSVITSVSLINCDNGSVRTYNTGDLGGFGGVYDPSQASLGAPNQALWRWRLYANGSAGSQAEDAWWMATVGKQIKVVFQLTGGPLRSTTVFDYCCNPANNKLVKFRTANIVKNPGNTVYGRWSRAKYNPKTRKYTMLNGARTTY